MSTRLDRITNGASGGMLSALGRTVADASREPSDPHDKVHRIPLDQIDEDPDNARKHYDEESLKALAEGIRRHGQLQNATCWRDESTGRYVLVAGHRRFRACRLAGIPTLMCMVLPRDAAMETKWEMALAENEARDNLTPLEAARHYQRLIEQWMISGAELARRIGVSQATVSRRLSLLGADADTQQDIDTGKTTATDVYNARRTPRATTDGTKAKRSSKFLEFNTRNGKGRLKRSGTLRGLIADLELIAQEEERRAA